MLDRHAFLLQARIDADALETWLEAGWVMPQREADAPRFSDVDLARAQLIRDLQDDMGVNEDGIAVVLALVDQIHGLRGTLRRILTCLHAQPEPIRRKIIAELREADAGDASQQEQTDRPS